VRFFIRDTELIDGLIGNVVDLVEPCSSLVLFPGVKLIGEKFVEPNNHSITDHHVSEPLELVSDCVGDSDLVEAEIDDVAEIFCKIRCQPLIVTPGESDSSALEL